jgi:hypothetical protein
MKLETKEYKMIQGKGFWIWQIINCENGNPTRIAAVAKAANLSWVTIKIADGVLTTNHDKVTGKDLIPPVIEAFRGIGVQILGWQYVYGHQPVQEAGTAIAQIKKFNLDGYIIDAESEYEVLPGRESSARTHVNLIRNAFPSLPVGLCSFRFPSLHPGLPWLEFLTRCDYNMPQVYWEQSHNPSAQLLRSIKEFSGLAIKRPVLPVGPTYKTGGWAPSSADIIGFNNVAKSSNLDGLSYFSWDECRRDLPSLWDLISTQTWGVAPAINPPASPTPAPTPITTPTPSRYTITIGPRWVYATSSMTGRAIGKVTNGQTITIVVHQGQVGQLDTGGWVDIGSGVKPV